jgi:DinB superfamily
MDSTIEEIYVKNASIREQLKLRISKLNDEQLNLRLENSWTILEVVEHIAIVESGIAGICTALLKKSQVENIPNTGKANLSETFAERTILLGDRRKQKVEAPERVLPTGKLSIAESFAKMAESSEILNQLRNGLEAIDTQKATFPHPFFGELSATEWLVLIGGHEFRHIDQIDEILSKQ